MAEVIKTATNSDIETLKKRQKIRNIILKVITYVFLLIMVFIIIFPFYYFTNTISECFRLGKLL